MLGVEPEELIKRPMEYFIEKYGDKERFELITKRWNRYERLRCILLSNVRQQRASLIKAGLNGTHSPLLEGGNSFAKVSALSESSSPSKKLDLEINILMQERQRLERFERQQAQEVERLLQYEINVSRVQQELVRKAESQKRDEAARAKEKLRRQREAEEKKRQIELLRPDERRRETDLDNSNVHKKQEERLWFDQQTKQDEERRRRAGRKQEQDGLNNQKEARLKAEIHQLQQRQEVERKQVEMNERDAQRRRIIEAKREQKAQEIADKQRRNKMRILLVLQDKEEIRVEQLRAFELKQQQSESRRQKYNKERQLREQHNKMRALQKKEATDLVQQHLYDLEQQCRERLAQLNDQVDQRLQRKESEKNQARLLYIREQSRQEHKRKMVHRHKEEQLQQKQATLIRKVDEKALITRKMQQDRQKTLQSRYEDALLRDEELQATLARREKADEYRVSYLLERIALDDEKTRRVRDERRSLLRRREEIKRAAEMQKYELLKVVQKLKSKKMSKDMASQLLDQLQSPRLAHLNKFAGSAVVSRSTFVETRRHQTLNSNGRVRPRSANPTYHSSSPAAWSTSTPLNTVKELQSDLEPTGDLLTDPEDMHEKLRSIQKQQNRELIATLEEEYQAEIDRQDFIEQQSDSKERERLEDRYREQRVFASERIKKLTQQHDDILNDYMKSCSATILDV
uniref:Uncharacterized protein AlNc14C9G1169 n=1 Tax=Albugo laibachii Nc14 TaxID=890382 RepID=F0W2B9_9STRA|nr:conserved hypothetical protein [Albugo laibachii Nc14]|eukprot:CCA15204.1 conserved hypothetical protein [Albugo laibachii Nc14]